jgi:hypothetical protein
MHLLLQPPQYSMGPETSLVALVHKTTYDLYSPVHNVLKHAYLLLVQVGGGWALEFSSFLDPKWHSPIGSMPFHRAQKLSNSRALPIALIMDMHASKTLCTVLYKS